MPIRTGKVILARGIKLDKSYKNIMDYSEQQMVSLLQSKAVATFSDCSFLRPNENIIDLEIPYGQALQANYMGFENPDYSNKWFFAFIDKIEYISNKTTRFYLTIDILSTWFDYWTPRSCFVVREHVNDDTIGLHTINEGLDVGEFVINSSQTLKPDKTVKDVNNNTINWKFPIFFQVTELASGISIAQSMFNAEYNGVFSGLYYFAVDSLVGARDVINKYVSKPNAIISIFLAPKEFLDGARIFGELGYNIYVPQDSTCLSNLMDTTTINRPSTIDGYIPKNNKLFIYPSSYIYITNNAGIDVTMRYEDFKNATPKFFMAGALGQGCSVKLMPVDYKRLDNTENFSYGIMGAKYPICAWASDYYTNWVTQNAVNTGLNIASSVLSAGASVATGNVVGGAMSLIQGVGSVVNQHYQASLTPDQAHGNLSGSDILIGSEKYFTINLMSVRSDIARTIDDFYTMFGYKINKLKMPNQTGRQYWNYVQIAEGESIGFTGSNISIPSEDMEMINQAYQKGVTIWHNHDNLGDYSLNNVII